MENLVFVFHSYSLEYCVCARARVCTVFDGDECGDSPSLSTVPVRGATGSIVVSC